MSTWDKVRWDKVIEQWPLELSYYGGYECGATSCWFLLRPDQSTVDSLKEEIKKHIRTEHTDQIPQ